MKLASLPCGSASAPPLKTPELRKLWLLHLAVLLAIPVPSNATAQQPSAPQPAVLSTTLSSNQIIIFPDANTPATQSIVPGLPVGAQPHGVAYVDSDHVLVADGGNSRIFVVQISTASLVSTIDTAAAGYDGSGTIAVSPDGSAALVMGGTGLDSIRLKVIHAPFTPASTITFLDYPGTVATYQTQAIVFNSAGRAFIRSSGGISVLDPPYTSVAFSFPVFGPGTSGSGAIAISPDGNTLLTTCACNEGFDGNSVKIFHAPFSDSSTPVSLLIPDADRVDGIAIAPDGGSAIVVSVVAHHAAVIKPPFSFDSVVETFTLPPGMEGFEDVGISADSQTAILTGQSTAEAAVFIRAPFTTAGAVVTAMPISGVANPARGQGAVRFRPATATAPLQLTSAVSRKAHGGGGDFNIDLPLSGTPGVECRSTGGAYMLVFSFSNNVVSGNASVTSGVGSVTGTPSFSGSEMTVSLAGVTNAQTVTVTLSNVTDASSQVLANTPASAGFLIGDTNGDRTVNSGDALQTRNRSGQAASVTNFRSDVNADGFVNSGDALVVRSRSGTSLP